MKIGIFIREEIVDIITPQSATPCRRLLDKSVQHRLEIGALWEETFIKGFDVCTSDSPTSFVTRREKPNAMLS